VSVSGDLENWTLQFDIGNIQYGKIWGYKFLDTYATTYPFQPNGVFDSNEYGLGNWEITLDGNTTEGAHVHLVRYTDNIENIGYYEFASLLPGTYTVSETQLSGYWATTQLSKTVMVYAYPNAPVSLRIDFGNLVPSPDPEVNFVLQAGWNMWSTPIDVSGLTAKSLLQEVGPNGLWSLGLTRPATVCRHTWSAAMRQACWTSRLWSARAITSMRCKTPCSSWQAT
jgi:hypothetical protein